MMPLRISEHLNLPDTIVTETVAMLAKRGMGKSNAAVVMAEEFTSAGFQWVAIDPKGDWWGVRSSTDGKGPGLSVPIFGGRHADVPLESTAGALMANLVVERGLTCILDVSLFSKTEQIKFVTDFAETLFRAIGDDPRPLHLFLEEAEEFLPQRVDARSARMVGAYSKISKQGRTAGLGVTLITQRSASLNKDALSQTDTLILFRTVSPHDRKAVVAWTEFHGESKEVAETLAGLEPGESWIISPGFLGSIQRVKWRRRRTFDSGATPVAGMKRKAPVTLADIDLREINDRIADTIERAKAEDPKALHRQIADLRKQLASATANVKVEQRIVEVPTVPPDLAAAVRSAADLMRQVSGALDDAAAHLTGELVEVKLTDRPPKPRLQVAEKAAVPRQTEPDDGEVKLKAGARRILETLARHHPMTFTRAQVGTMTGFKITGGTFTTYWGVLKRAGYIEERSPKDISVTAAGLEAAGVTATQALTTQDMLDMWRSKLKAGARTMLDVLVDAYPAALSKEELGSATQMVITGGTFGTYLGVLRRNGLIEVQGNQVQASESLFIDGAA